MKTDTPPARLKTVLTPLEAEASKAQAAADLEVEDPEDDQAVAALLEAAGDRRKAPGGEA